MGIKPTIQERKKEAEKTYQDDVSYTKEKIVKLVKECLEEKKIVGEAVLVNVKKQPVNYEAIMKKYKTEAKTHIIFIQFVKKGHIAVVGAGMDIGFSRNEKYGTWKVICGSPGIEWDDENVIIVPVRGLKSVGMKNVDNILQCRNGVEQCIGEYLMEKNISILNCYQHLNYSKIYWEKCENNNYNLK